MMNWASRSTFDAIFASWKGARQRFAFCARVIDPVWSWQQP